jgi:hypothetical protein
MEQEQAGDVTKSQDTLRKFPANENDVRYPSRLRAAGRGQLDRHAKNCRSSQTTHLLPASSLSPTDSGILIFTMAANNSQKIGKIQDR